MVNTSFELIILTFFMNKLLVQAIYNPVGTSLMIIFTVKVINDIGAFTPEEPFYQDKLSHWLIVLLNSLLLGYFFY